jgi:hypothetical protein
LEPGTNPVMQGGRKNPTEKNKETPKKPLGVLSLLSSSSDQGVPIKAETNLGTGQKLEKTVPKGLGSRTNLLKCAGSWKHLPSKKRLWSWTQIWQTRVSTKEWKQINTTRRRSWEKAIRRAFFTKFIISAQMNHVSLKILGDNM